jgi:hypothetical protein
MGNRYTDVFRGAGIDDLSIENGVKLDYFMNLPNASAAIEALDLIMNPAAILTLGKVHTEDEINRMKRAVFRACISHGVPLPSRAVVQARMLGVVVPT